MTKTKTNAVHAFHLLNQFVGDLAAGSQVHRFYHSPRISNLASATTIGCVNRMCLSHLFLTLDKWEEFYNRFHRVVPTDCRAACKALVKEVQRRKIRRFRNTFVGHIWSNKLGRPLTQDEIESAVQDIVEGDQDGFVRWCTDHESNMYPATVISIVEHTRDRIREDFNLSQAELFPTRSTQ
jgi:hypothetical protein